MKNHHFSDQRCCAPYRLFFYVPSKNRLTLVPIYLSLLFAGSLVWQGCGFCVNSEPLGYLCTFNQAPLTPTSASETTVISASPDIHIIHGSSCGESVKDGDQRAIQLVGQARMPSFCNQATVFLNGWSFSYLREDHHINGIGVLIKEIQFDVRQNLLTWKAVGILTDKNFDDPYSFCYTYTVMGWNNGTLNLMINPESNPCMSASNASVGSSFMGIYNPPDFVSTSMQSYNRLYYNPAFSTLSRVGVFPQGFGFKYPCGDDHHLLQLAYSISPAEDALVPYQNYYYRGRDTLFSRPHFALDSGYISWVSNGILKDNDHHRDYYFSESVVVLGGQNINIVTPAYHFTPKDDANACLGADIKIKDTVVVENIAYDYAIPIMTGWDLAYNCDDEHVRDIGIRISEWNYQKNPNSTRGTLTYMVEGTVKDDDDWPGVDISYNVSLLMIKPSTGGGGSFTGDHPIGGLDSLLLER